MVIGDADGPARRGGLTRDGDVTAEVDQYAAAGGVRGRGRRTIRGKRLGRGTEVELHPRGQRDEAGATVQADCPPTGDAAPRWQSRRRSEAGAEVAVIARQDERLADRRID